MHQRQGLSTWYCALCLCAIGLVPDHLAWAQEPNETYDFNITKGIVEFGRGRYAEAADLFNKARQAVPNDPEATEYVGQTLLRRQQYHEAEDLFHDVTIRQPARAQAWLGLAISRSHLGKYHEALAALEQAQKLEPNNPLVYFYQGVVSHELKSFNQSSALLSRAMALSPDLTPTVRYYTGISYYERGMIDQGLNEIEAAIASGEPESELARIARAVLQQRTAVPKSPRPWDLNLSVSGQYDTNVVLLPIGIQPPGGNTGISQKDDYRFTTYARGEYRPIQTAGWTAGITYGFYQSLHRTLTAFDIQDHAPSAFLQHQMGSVTARLQYAFDYVRVGENPFLLSHAVQPIITIAESNSLFTQLQFRYQSKDFQDGRFAGNSFRDGQNWLAGVTQYAYFANGTGHVRVGYTFDTDRTGGGNPAVAAPGVQTHADWSYQAHRVSIGLGVPDFWTLKSSLAFDYYHMNYDNPSSFSLDGTTKRRDHIMFLTATISRPLTDWLSIAAGYNYTRDQSNLPLFSYTRNIFSLTLSSQF